MNKKNENERRHRAKKRKIINRYKAIRGCLHCGIRDSRCLQFDHRNPAEKSFNISSSACKTLKALSIEIKKCDVLCANCHAIKTFENKDWIKCR